MSEDLHIDVPTEFVEAIADAVAARLPAAASASTPAVADPSRVTLTKAEAAEALGVSIDHLERHVVPDLRIIRSGRLRLIPVSELEAWVEANAARLGEWR